MKTRQKQPFAALIYSIIGVLLLAVVIIAVAIIFVIGGGSCTGDGCAFLSSAIIVPLTTLITCVILAYPILCWFLFTYELTEHAITVNSGILFRQYETIDFSRIQTIDNERGPLLWFFGLTEVRIWTASADQLNFSIEKNSMRSRPSPDTTLILERDTAQELKDFIMNSKSAS